MKAYFFDPESGIFQGEVHEDANYIQYIDGITTIPPLEYNDEEILLFDSQNQKWTVQKVVEVRKKLGIGTKAGGA